jgi:hypothetical protein
MADGPANRSLARGSHSICVPAAEAEYNELVKDPARFRPWLAGLARRSPELFPAGFDRGFRMKDRYRSRKLGVTLRRVELRDGRCYLVRPSFVTPYLTGRVAEVGHGLFLRKFGVPLWALARVFGRDPMYWFRLECGLGRASVVGATVRQAQVLSRPVGRRAPPGPRRREGVPGHHRGRGLLPGRRRGRDGRDRRSDRRLRRVPGRGPRRRPRLHPRHRQHRRLVRHPRGVGGAGADRRAAAVLPARVAQGPRPGQEPGADVLRSVETGVGGVPRAGQAVVLPAPPAAGRVGRAERGRGRAGGRVGPVPQAGAVARRLRPPRRPPHQQHARAA